MGTVHGGILCTAADAAMGLAYGSVLPQGQAFTTVELKINYLRPVFHQTVHARGKILSRGRSTGLLECRLLDEDERLLAFATSTCMVLHGDAAAQRNVQPDMVLPGPVVPRTE